MARKCSDQLSLLALEERDALGLHARGGACAKAIDEEVEGVTPEEEARGGIEGMKRR